MLSEAGRNDEAAHSECKNRILLHAEDHGPPIVAFLLPGIARWSPALWVTIAARRLCLCPVDWPKDHRKALSLDGTLLISSESSSRHARFRGHSAVAVRAALRHNSDPYPLDGGRGNLKQFRPRYRS